MSALSVIASTHSAGTRAHAPMKASGMETETKPIVTPFSSGLSCGYGDAQSGPLVFQQVFINPSCVSPPEVMNQE